MLHDTAFAMVCEICPGEAGRLWETTRAVCDTANAVSEWYDDDEVSEARADLEPKRDSELIHRS